MAAAHSSTIKEQFGSTSLMVNPGDVHAGLDSATTFTVTKWLRVVTHAMRLTMVVSLLQPAPEVFALFDDILLLTDGCRLSASFIRVLAPTPICIVARHAADVESTEVRC